jgi:integrase
MLEKGVDRFKVIATNALATMKPLPEGDPTKVRRALTVDEVAALFKHSMPYMIPVWRLFAITGMRHNELVNLHWTDVDFEDKSISIRASVAKGKRSRRVLLDDMMLVMLRELRDETDRRPEGWDREHVFVNQIGRPHRQNLLRKFYGTCKRAGITDGKRNGAVDIHSLRVTFATLSLEGGASPKAVQTILGHKTLDMTMKVYAKATDRSLREAVNALPFATATAPDHVLAIGQNEAVSGQDLAQIYPKSSERATA